MTNKKLKERARRNHEILAAYAVGELERGNEIAWRGRRGGGR